LAALRFGDLDGRVLTIERAVSGEQVGPTKTRQVRRLTLGRTTVELWRVSEAAWRRRVAGEIVFGEWLFSKDLDHRRRLTTSGLGHWFAELRDEAGLEGVSLHRLRHTVATYLVGRGDLLQAQQRLGHRDASTTLRNYAHAMPLEDEAVADDIDEMLRSSGNLRGAAAQPPTER
jgi:integrase